jgi:hypothetical protein
MNGEVNIVIPFQMSGHLDKMKGTASLQYEFLPLCALGQCNSRLLYVGPASNNSWIFKSRQSFIIFFIFRA